MTENMEYEYPLFLLQIPEDNYLFNEIFETVTKENITTKKYFNIHKELSIDINEKTLEVINKFITLSNQKEMEEYLLDIKNNNINIINNKYFISCYYYLTNHPLNFINKLLNIKLKGKENNILIPKNIFGIRKVCDNCKESAMFYFPINRKERDHIISNNTICKECKKKIKEEEEKEALLKKEIQNKLKEKQSKVEDIMSDIIVIKNEDIYHIKFKEKDIISKISNEFIFLINEMIEFSSDLFYDSSKSKKIKKIMEEEKYFDIVNTSIFVNIYQWFTNLPLHYISDVSDKKANNLIVIDNNIKESVDNRSGSMFPNYIKFKSWLYNYYKNNSVTFNDLFNQTPLIEEVKTNTIICNSTEQINNLKTMPYKEYLQTDHWREKRKGALHRANNKCQLCGSKENLHVHHNTYDNRGQEKDEDLVVLCETCHARHHGKLIEEENINEKQIEINNKIKTKIFISEINIEIDDNDLDNKINEYISKNNITNVISMQTNFNSNNLYSVLLVYSI